MGRISALRNVNGPATARGHGRVIGTLSVLGLAGAVLSGCGTFSSDAPAYLCPESAIIGDLSVLSRFGGASAPPDQPAFYGEIVNVAGTCSYDDDSLEFELQTTMVFDRPAGRPEVTEQVTYFVAIARPDGAVIGKQQLPVPIDFRTGEIRAGYQDEVTLEVPLPSGASTGQNFDVFVGFQLTQAELDYNQRQRQR